MRLSEYETLKKVLPLLLSARIIPSKAELAKRSKLSDDNLGRFFERFEREHGFPLTEMKKGRLALTERGRRAYTLYTELWSLGDSEEFSLAKLKLQVESILSGVLAAALIPTFELWTSSIHRPCIWRLDPDVRHNIGQGVTDLGIGCAGAEEAVPEEEALGSFEWCVLHPANWRDEASESMSMDQLPKDQWLLLPDLAFGTAGLADLFVHAGHKLVMECDHLTTYVAANVGVAVLPDVFGSTSPHGTIKRRLVGLPPITVRMFLPRGGAAALSSVGMSLVENLRAVIRDGVRGGDNSVTPSTADTVRKQAMPKATNEEEDVFEELVEEAVTPMEGVLS